MKKTIILTSVLLAISPVLTAQKLKDKMAQLAAKANGETVSDGSLPKGIEIYDQEHSDKTGMSGKYYSMYPVHLQMGNKAFQLNEVTIEYRPEMYTGVIHWINNEVEKGLRYGDADLSKINDFSVASGVPALGIKIIEKFNNYSFAINNNNQFKNTSKSQSFMDGAKLIRYSKDSDIIIISRSRVFDSKNCVPVYKKGDTYEVNKLDSRYDFGQQFNILSKDPEKLKDWDSTKLMEISIEVATQLCSDIIAAQSEDRNLPKQEKDDNELEKKLYDLIKPMAANDKPIAWGDKFQYVYLHKDWTVTYTDHTKTKILYRTCIAIATSCGWTEGECRYIAVHVKQNHNGSEYGKMELGFGGSLIPISKDKVSQFKH